MTNYKKKLQRILGNDYGVRSGVYSAIDPGIRMELDEYGEYQPIFSGKETNDTYRKLLRIDMMSDESPNEDLIAKELFGSIVSVRHDDVLGYYTDLYAGYVKEGDYRMRGSSGGFGSWILAELLREKKIDGVIHVRAVDPNQHDGLLFEYTVSRTVKAVEAGAKSRYYPMELSKVLDVVKKNKGAYAVIGIPEFITELRLLAKEEPLINERIKYMIGLVCGHQKTAKYVEALAWQHGIEPGDLQEVDFRVKQPDSTALDYLQAFTGTINGKKVTLRKRHEDLFGEDWALGFFKSKFSDFTDNTFNETADVVLGDAWLEQYNNDGLGNNIIIVRNPDIGEIVKKALKRGALQLDEVGPDLIKASQSGLVHHTRDELPYRLSREKAARRWVPKKRTLPADTLPATRKRVQELRYEMARKSHKAYREAVARNDWQYFQDTMGNLVGEYYELYGAIRDGRLDVINQPSYLQKVINKLSVVKSKGKQRIKTHHPILATQLKSAKRPVNEVRIKLKVRTRINEASAKSAAKKEAKRLKREAAARMKQHYQNNKEYLGSDGAILTLPGYFNYGNLLQRYALQKFLQLNGRRYVSYVRDIPIETAEDAKKFKYTYDFVERTIWRKAFDKRDQFKSYIVGSDQVWRNWEYDDIYDSLGFFYLDFTRDMKTRRITYAASIGQDTLEDALIPKEFAEHVKPVIKSFAALSIRELSGIELARKEWGVEAQLTIDPTLLLDRDEYEKLIESAPYKLKESTPIFTYFIRNNRAKKTLTKAICKQVGKGASGIDLEEETAQLPPVEYWIKGIRDAELLITDSFHGVVFAIIFNTPFVLLESGTGGAGRTATLLGKLGLEDRYVTSDNKNFDIRSLKPIDWGGVNKVVASLRHQSARWLMKAVKSRKGSTEVKDLV